jgi:N-methylhydantoinase B
VNGGKAAALNRFVFRDSTGEHQVPLVTKTTDVKVTNADIVRLESPGGGGFGDPRQRDADLVARDVRFG